MVRICKFLNLLDPETICADPDPDLNLDPSFPHQEEKKIEKNLDFCFVTWNVENLFFVCIMKAADEKSRNLILCRIQNHIRDPVYGFKDPDPY